MYSGMLQCLEAQLLAQEGGALLVDRVAAQALLGKSLEEHVLEALFRFEDSPEHVSETTPACYPAHYLDQLRHLLALSLLTKLFPDFQKYQAAVAAQFQEIRQRSYFPGFQLSGAMIALIAFVLGLSVVMPRPELLPSGAAPVEVNGDWSWSNFPHPSVHAELGLIWALLGKISDNQECLLAAQRVAEWQVNTLDGWSRPLLGLFAQEKSSTLARQLTVNCLLFMAVSSPFASAQAEQLKQLFQENAPIYIPAWLTLCAFWMEQLGIHAVQATPAAFALLGSASFGNVIYDPHTALVGHRDSQTSVVATLFGGNTGMGAFQGIDVGVVSYGPQVLPLGDCRGFGIERGFVLGRSIESDIVSTCQESGFSLQGKSRLVMPPEVACSAITFHNPAVNLSWIESRQRYEGKLLEITASFLSLTADLKNLAFVFYVKSPLCVVDGLYRLLPQSLDRYQSASCRVDFKGEKTHLYLEAVGEKEGTEEGSRMEVIPLAGGDDYWGADFLVAYFFESGTLEDHRWTIGSLG